MKKLIIVPLLLISLICSATNYYIKNGGNNSNTGLSDAQAWATVSRVNEASFVPGDVIAFKKGSVFSPSTLTIPTSGTSGHPIVFTTYGTGAAPIFASTNSFIVYISSKNYVTIDGLVLDGNYGGVANANHCCKIDGTSSYIIMTNCVFRNAWSCGLQFGRYEHHCTISHSSFHNNGRDPATRGYSIYSQGNNIIFEYLDCYNEKNYGIHIYNGYDATEAHDNIVRYCYLHDNGSAGVIVSSGANNKVYYNIIVRNAVFGIRIQYGGTNTLAYNNTVYNNQSDGIYIGSDSPGCIVRNNIIYNNSGTPVSNEGSATVSNNLTTNPNFVNAGGSYLLDTDFKIPSNSAAKDAGTDVDLTQDYFGSKVPYNTIQDIGAYEFGSATSAPAKPVYQNSVIENASPALLVMTYNLSLANIAPPPSAFTVLVNSVARGISATTISGTKVQLTLASPVIKGDVVKVTYTMPASNQIQITSGELAASLISQTAINNVTTVVQVATTSQVVLTVNPNPVHRILNAFLSYTPPLTGDQANALQILRILDISGNILIEKLLIKSTLNLKIPINLRPGIYIVQLVISGLEMASQKIIVY